MATHLKVILRSGTIALIGLILVIGLALPAAAEATGGGPGTGPGGVGSTDGGGSLRLWLDAGSGAMSDAACTTAAVNAGPVGCWSDQSGSGNHFVQANSLNQPLYAASGLNGRPVVQFNGSSHYLERSYSADLNSNSFTLLLVTHTTGGGGAYRAPFASRCGTDNATRGGYNFYSTDANLWEFWVWWLNGNAWSRAVGPTTADQAWHILGGLYDNPGLYQTLFVDGTNKSSQPGISYRANSACPARVGAGGTEGAAALFFQGEIAEVIFYNLPLNTAQRTLVDNYLAARYNLAISNDRYTGNDPAYVLNVAGIGKESDGYSDEGHSAGIILRNGGFLSETGDYLLAGHAAASIANTTGDLPTGGDWAAGKGQRWTRVWYLARTDPMSGGGLVGIDFDLGEAGLSGAPVGGASNYRLLMRSGTSGQFSEVAQATAISGDRVTFNGLDSTTLGGYYTLGTVDKDGSPTAVTVGALGGRSAARLPVGLGLLGLLGLAAWFGLRKQARAGKIG